MIVLEVHADLVIFNFLVLANVHQRYEEARRRGLGQEDIIALVKLYR